LARIAEHVAQPPDSTAQWLVPGGEHHTGHE
jgi:hypothetical protein